MAEALRGGAELAEVTDRARDALLRHGGPVVELAKEHCVALGLEFAGIDLSPAPHVDDSIVAAMELAGHGLLGDPGTFALVAAAHRRLEEHRLADMWFLRVLCCR